MALGTEGLPCGARGKKSSRHVGSCRQAVTAMVTGFLRPVRRWAGPGLQSELRGPNSNHRARSGRPGMGRLDCAQAGWISWALLVTTTAFGHWGAGVRPELALDRGWQEACARWSSRQAASSTSRAVRQQSDCAAWVGPASVRACGGPGSQGPGLSSRRLWFWLVVAPAAMVGTVSQTTQARPGESLWTEAA